jgi:DNA-binding FadR family transcriptional regulator
VAAAHNNMLADLYGHLTEGLRSVLETIVHAPLSEHLRYQREEHIAVVDAIAAGDPDAAQRCAEKYLSESVDSVRMLRDADE